jgi:hypothetical protein
MLLVFLMAVKIVDTAILQKNGLLSGIDAPMMLRCK